MSREMSGVGFAVGASRPDQGRSGAVWIDGRFMHASGRPLLRW